MASFPELRMRRLRRRGALRNMIREVTLEVTDLVYPLFVTYGTKIKEEIESLPGQFRLSEDLVSSRELSQYFIAHIHAYCC